jgi:hypothetical protein
VVFMKNKSRMDRLLCGYGARLNSL